LALSTWQLFRHGRRKLAGIPLGEIFEEHDGQI
jgi:hypothetical protein